jgi:hypothetical protein
VSAAPVSAQLMMTGRVMVVSPGSNIHAALVAASR